MGDETGQAYGDTIVAKASIRVAIGSILRAPPTSDPSQPCFGNRVLTIAGRSLTGLNQAHVASEARLAIDMFEPLVQVSDIAVEMTPANAVNAITVRYRIIESGTLHDVRVEIPT